MSRDDEVLQKLEAADWESIAIKLIRYANWRALKYRWKSGSPSQLPGGMTPEDVAFGAIEKLWNKTRKWDPVKYPDLFTHLKWIVDSDMDHLADSMEHRLMRRISVSEDGELDDPLPVSSTPLSEEVSNNTPEANLIACEKEDYEQKVKERIYELVKGDEDLELLFMCFESGIGKPEQIAKEMGWDVTKVYNLKRKLSRKASAIIKIIGQE